LGHAQPYRFALLISTGINNPPGELPLHRWQVIFLDDLDLIWTARHAGRLAAFASLRGGGDVYWFGALPAFAHDAETLNVALKRAEIAQDRDWLPRIQFELDSTSPEAVSMLRRLPIESGEATLTYQT
jgi:hypothetical protein